MEKIHPVFAEQRKVTPEEEELTLTERSASIFQLSYFSIQQEKKKGNIIIAY